MTKEETLSRKIIDLVATSVLEWMESEDVFIRDRTTGEVLPNAELHTENQKGLKNMLQIKLDENNIKITL